MQRRQRHRRGARRQCACLSAADLDAAESAFAEADVVLAQLEVPLATVEHGAELAARYRKPFVLNPAPAVKLPEKPAGALHPDHPQRV